MPLLTSNVMHKKVITTVIGIIIVSGLLWTHHISLDGLYGNFLSVIFQEDTLYTKSYTDLKYRSLKKGMSKNDVASIIGKPFYTKQEHNSTELIEIWWYSKSPADTHYRMRVVAFTNNVVNETIHYYYVD